MLKMWNVLVALASVVVAAVTSPVGKLVALVASFLVSIVPQSALAQMPTGIPTQLQTQFDNLELMIAALGIATLIVIYLITSWKYGRGLS